AFTTSEFKNTCGTRRRRTASSRTLIASPKGRSTPATNRGSAWTSTKHWPPNTLTNEPTFPSIASSTARCTTGDRDVGPFIRQVCSMSMTIKPKTNCRFDLVSLGEIMLRLDPGDGRVSTARTFTAWEGGGEYNVARGLKRCFGLDTGVVSA